MNFEFSEEQNLLRDQARGFLADACPLTVTRRILEGEEAYAEELWKGVVELGWTATVIPEAYGGLGLGYLELCVLAEELGRCLAPIPFSSSVYLATEALLCAGTQSQKETWLAKLAAGTAVGCVALYEQPGNLVAKRIDASVTAGRLSGTKIMVADGDVADLAVVLARSGDGLGLFLADLKDSGVSRSQVPVIDPSRSHAEITFDQVQVEPMGTGNDGLALSQRLFERAAVLFAFEQVGGSEAALQQAREYALGRYAFGRPIAGYQAIKHKLARMYVATVLARSNSYYGAWALSAAAPELPVAAAVARVSAIQAFRECAEENVQTHGGMGFTWEFDCHLFYRRSKLLALNIGSEPVWKDQLISSIEASRRAA